METITYSDHFKAGKSIKVHTIHYFTYLNVEKGKTVKHPLPFYCFKGLKYCILALYLLIKYNWKKY